MSEMLSVTEYAALTGKDPGNIRRMLAAGRLEGQKVGKQWVIPADTEYPADRREKTGAYRNWRKRVQLNANKELMSAIREMVSCLAEIYGPLLHKVILYGSYARGTQDEESDVDIALILNGEPPMEMTDDMIECVAYKELETEKALSVIDIQKTKMDEWKDVVPFYRNIEKEGICLWKEA